jgi:nitrate/nitrite transporter NarK
VLAFRWEAWSSLSDVLKDKLDIEDRLAVLELLVTALTLMVAISLNDTDARSPKARDVAIVAAIFILAVVFPLVGRQVKRAYRPNLAPELSDFEAKCANALGVWVLSVCYFFTHLPS